jgi:antitoxin ParD1/3/4
LVTATETPAESAVEAVGHQDRIAGDRRGAKRGARLPFHVLSKLCEIRYVGDKTEAPTMPTRNTSLTPEQDAFIKEAVKSGEYQNASEAVRDALRVLQQRRREDALKLEALRRQIDAGIDALARGEFTEIDDTDLDTYFDVLAARSGKRAR